MKKSVDFFFDNQIDGGITKITSGDMVFWNPLYPSIGGDVFKPPPPSGCCCAEPPGDTLKLISADFLAFYDKWYGAAGRTTVDGFYVWSNANCPPPAALKVPTATYLDQISDSNSLCADPPLIFDAFNSMRDAAVLMGQLVVVKPKLLPGSLPCPSKVACPQFDQFDVRFTPTRVCDDPLLCDFDGFPDNKRTAFTRVKKCERLCVFHYLELQAIVDDMMTNGVVEIDYGTVGGVEIKSGSLCGSPFVIDDVCIHDVVTNFIQGAKVKCYPVGGCCYGPNASISGLDIATIEASAALINTAACDSCNLCETCQPGCPPSPYAAVDVSDWETFVKESIVQNGPSTFNQTSFCKASWDVPVTITEDTYQTNCSTCDHPTSHTVSSDVLTIERLSNGKWTVSRVTDRMAGGCTGLTNAAADELCNIDPSFVTINGKLVSFTVTTDEASCENDCPCNSFPCPGDIDSTTINDQKNGFSSIKAGTKYLIDTDGSGTKTERSISLFLKYVRACPDSGLTAIKMLDARIAPINSTTFTNTTISAPALAQSGCPDNSVLQCAGFECLRGYGELA